MRTEISIHNFDKVIDDIILERGWDYYCDGHIKELDVFDDEVSAVVEGSYDYKVRMTLDTNGNVLNHYCNCPYDWGEYCKHEAAVMYALRENFKSNSQSGMDKLQLKKLLIKQSSEDLAEILYNMALSDKRLREKLILKFDEKTYTADECIELVKKCIDMYEDYEGINIDNGAELADDIYAVIDKADDFMENSPEKILRFYETAVNLITDIEFYENDYYNTYYYIYGERDFPNEMNAVIFYIEEKIEEVKELMENS